MLRAARTLGFLIAILATPAAAQNHSGSASAHEGHADVSHAHPTHAVGGFIGGVSTGDATEASFGLEYEARLASWIGVGAVGELIPGAHHDEGASLALAAVHFHPAGGLRLTVGAGAEFIGGEHPEQEAVFRVGSAYDLPVGSWAAIAPTLNVDFVNGESNLVFGAALLIHF